jgi:hypothetical protein
MMMKKPFLIFILLYVFSAVQVWAAENVRAAVSLEGETFNFELAGQKNWDYDLKRVKVGAHTKVQLFVKSLDSSTVNGIKNIVNPFVESITATKNAIDNKWLIEFILKNDRVETFDYLTDQPSKLILDFYASDAAIPATKELPKKNKIQKPDKPKSGSLVTNEEKRIERAPADVDYLTIDQEGGIETSILSRSGLFDAGDNKFKRFNLNDSEYKD